jgi:hypothetical protein
MLRRWGWWRWYACWFWLYTLIWHKVMFRKMIAVFRRYDFPQFYYHLYFVNFSPGL